VEDAVLMKKFFKIVSDSFQSIFKKEQDNICLPSDIKAPETEIEPPSRVNAPKIVSADNNIVSSNSSVPESPVISKTCPQNMVLDELDNAKTPLCIDPIQVNEKLKKREKIDEEEICSLFNTELSVCDDVAGAFIEHKTYGKGIINSVLGSSYTSSSFFVTFSGDKKPRQFTSEAFRNGFVCAMSLPKKETDQSVTTRKQPGKKNHKNDSSTESEEKAFNQAESSEKTGKNKPDVDENKKIEWTEEQLRIIQADPNQRFIVDAGPGTGKTAVACARIAWLIENGRVSPNGIWLISFTRTAVNELRNRIKNALSDKTKAHSIRIATLDSHAWAMQSGFNDDAEIKGSYDENIRNVIALVQENDGVFEYLSGVEHLLIDEAQDFYGDRVELLLEIIDAIPTNAGVSVLCDEAQAIFEFTEKKNSTKETTISGTLIDNIRKYFGDSFNEFALKEIHRTSDAILTKLFSMGREIIRNEENDSASSFCHMKNLISQTNHGELESMEEALHGLEKAPEDTFLLFRSRNEALKTSHDLDTLPHRLRMSGLPKALPGWIGKIFWDWTEPLMNQGTFFDRWGERLGGKCSETNLLSPEAAWETLVRVAGKTLSIISVKNLSTKLSRNNPCADLNLHEFGYRGPIIGTIHGAKGREAIQVRLFLNSMKGAKGKSQSNNEEEARVLFVGATRAKSELFVGTFSPEKKAYKVFKTGRAFSPLGSIKNSKDPKAYVEIGHEKDVDPEGMVGKKEYSRAHDALVCQERIALLPDSIILRANASLDSKNGNRYCVKVEENPQEIHFLLSPAVFADMKSIANDIFNKRSFTKATIPLTINDLRIFGTRTISLAHDDNTRNRIHYPWSESGFILAPLVLGYGVADFKGGR
jgi:hypothetical protein